ncbi:methyltransferase domain-containing protein [Luethyella okanaganae]|uniref:Methyltransferase domain-containing protein n=1 Tax=Luethyella okanaganae TaxID=69372 RepID=A0ABW1VGS1_9MICO
MEGLDPYAATAGAYDLYNAPWRPAQLAALKRPRPLLRPEVGSILDVGTGSGLNLEWVLTNLPDAEVLASEPSQAMRSLALSRVAGHPEWFARVTLREEGFFATTLPTRIGGAILLGVIGHFDPGERAAVLAELAARLPLGGAALIDLQPPGRPQQVSATAATVATIGETTYRTIVEASPADAERMRWRMTYLSLEGDRILTEETVEHSYRHAAPETIAAEARDVGLNLEQLDDTAYWLLTRA